MPILVRPNNFEAEVLGSGLPVLVDFFGERCIPCLLLRPVLLGLGEEYAGQLKICLFNTDRERRESKADYEEKFRTIEAYGVMHLPTLLLFIDGALRRALVGLHTRQELLDILREEGLRLEPRVGNQPGPDEGEDGGERQQEDQ